VVLGKRLAARVREQRRADRQHRLRTNAPRPAGAQGPRGEIPTHPR
jgi:hypothetical protein